MNKYFAYLLINLLVPVATALGSAAFDINNSLFVFFATLSATLSASLCYELSKAAEAFRGETSSIERLVKMELERFEKSLKDAVEPIHKQVLTLFKVTDTEALLLLAKLIDHHNALAESGGLSSSSSSILVRHLVRYKLAKYVHALSEVRHHQTLPLASEPRMEVAIEALETVKEGTIVCAISTRLDSWVQGESERKYNAANYKAASLVGVEIRRIFVRPPSEERTGRWKEMVAEQRSNKIAIKVIDPAALQRECELLGATFGNVLIVGSGFLSRSVNESKHNGYVHTNPTEIERYQKLFNRAWAIAGEK